MVRLAFGSRVDGDVPALGGEIDVRDDLVDASFFRVGEPERRQDRAVHVGREHAGDLGLVKGRHELWRGVQPNVEVELLQTLRTPRHPHVRLDEVLAREPHARVEFRAAAFVDLDARGDALHLAYLIVLVERLRGAIEVRVDGRIRPDHLDIGGHVHARECEGIGHVAHGAVLETRVRDANGERGARARAGRLVHR